MFKNCKNLNSVKDIQNWNVSNVRDMGGMFMGCSNLSDLKPLNKWRVGSNVLKKSMFLNCNVEGFESDYPKWYDSLESEGHRRFN